MTDVATEPELGTISPWERAPAESDQAWQAFAEYRDMGPSRTVRKVAQTLGKSGSLISGWSAQHHWVARCEAWDDELDRERRAGLIERLREADSRHLDLCRQVEEKLREALATLDGASLTPHQFARLFRDYVSVERTILGQPTAVDPANGENDEAVVQSLTDSMAAYLQGVKDGEQAAETVDR